MYIDPPLDQLPCRVLEIRARFCGAVPSALPRIEAISEQIVSERYYKALKLARKLIDYEQSLLEQVKRNNPLQRSTVIPAGLFRRHIIRVERGGVAPKSAGQIEGWFR